LGALWPGSQGWVGQAIFAQSLQRFVASQQTGTDGDRHQRTRNLRLVEIAVVLIAQILKVAQPQAVQMQGDREKSAVKSGFQALGGKDRHAAGEVRWGLSFFQGSVYCH
jgi:hypothetical protein